MIKPQKRILAFIVSIMVVISSLTVFAFYDLLSGITSASVSEDTYAINDMAVFTVKTGTDITKIKLVNDDGSTYFIADIDKGFTAFSDEENERTWTISKKVQFSGTQTKTIYAGNYRGYSSKTSVVALKSDSVTIPPDESEKMEGFVRAKGNILVEGTGEGKEYLMKGIAFGNNVWGNPSKPIANHHTEESYKELSELGFNSIRFYLNYGLFEDDSQPYQYKQSGWDWLNENIVMAKKYNIRLVLNMHYPQGGYQSGADGMALWTNRENQKRLCALWTAIAQRYKDEIAIAAFDLVNEPIVPELTTKKESINQWAALAQEITDSIRTVDTNHLIIVERLNATKNLTTNQQDWTNDEDMNFFLIDDDNVAYEFHNYEPFQFTHQNASWTTQAGIFANYPDQNMVMPSGTMTWEGTTLSNPRLNHTKTGWQELTGQKYKAVNPNYKVGVIAMQCQNLGENGKVWFDDVTVKEYDENGNFVRNIYDLKFDDGKNLSLWSQNSSGTMSFDASTGYHTSGSAMAAGTTDDANIGYPGYFVIQQGYSYEISGFAKAENINTNTVIKLRVDFWNCDKVSTVNKEYLEDSVKEYLEFGQKHHVPMYLGEFGVMGDGFENGRGGEIWVKDMLDICKKYNINFNYHTYHEPNFGLYLNDSTRLPDRLNQLLWDTFQINL